MGKYQSSTTSGKRSKEKIDSKKKEKTSSIVQRFGTYFFDHEKQLIIAAFFLCTFFLFIGSILLYTVTQPESEAAVAVTELFNEKAEKTSLTQPRRLDGMIVANEDANPVPICVMIENSASTEVRPQSGLSQAQLVYEVIVEGGITRFMAVYAGEGSEKVGPVRSARDTYLEFVSELNCAYAHAGGSYSAELALYRFELRNINGLREYKYFWRDNEHVAPHNFFTASENLEQAVVDHSWDKDDPPNYATWTFVDRIDEPLEDALDIRILFGGSYNVEYKYNAEKGWYERYNGDQLQVDKVNNQTLTTKNIIVQHVSEGTYIEGKGRVNWPVTEEGNAEIFHSGKVIKARWKKEDRQSRTMYYTQDGEEVQLTRGNTWVEIVPPHITTEYE